MLENTYIHMLLNDANSFSTIFYAYSKPVFKKGPKKMSIERQKEIKSIEKEYNKIRQKLRPSVQYSDAIQKAKKTEGKNVRIRNTGNIDTKIISKITKTLPVKHRLLFNTHLGEALRAELTKTVDGKRAFHYHELIKASPVNFSFEKGVLTIENNKGYSFTLDMYEHVPVLQNIAALSRMKRKIDELKSGVRRKHADKRRELIEQQDLSPSFGKLHESMLKKRPTLSKKCKITKKGKDYLLRFIGRTRSIRRRNEIQLKIHDIFDFSLLNKYDDCSVRIRVYNPKLGVIHYATFHPGYGGTGSFIIDGTKNRLKVYDRARIRILEFKVRPKRKPAKAPVGKPAKTPKERLKIRKEAERARDAQAKHEREQRKDRLFDKYYNHIFKTDHFWKNKLLQDDKHFKRWDDLSIVLERVLSDPPFGIMGSTKQKLYIQEVVQAGRNAEVQGEDFFDKYPSLYKGGYDQYVEDYKRLKKKYDRTDGKLSAKENAQLTKIEDIAIGIARIYEALEKLKPLKAGVETNRDRLDRTIFLNAPNAEKIDLKEYKLGKYKWYGLDKLVHKEELSSTKISIIVPESVEQRLMQDVISAHSDLPPDMKRESDLAFAKENPARFLFHTFGLEFLIKNGALRKIGKDRYVLSRIPKRLEKVRDKKTKKVIKTHVVTDFWAKTAFQFLARGVEGRTAKAAQWERIRSKFDPHHKALRFIKKIFKSDKTSVGNNLKSGWSRLWHWEWAKKKYVSMSSLNKKTYGRNDFELEAVEKRGYLDLKSANQERYKDTGMYEIPEKNHDKLITQVNDYLAEGMILTLRNAPQSKAAEMLLKLRRTFGVGVLPFKKPYKENINHNVGLIVNEIGVKSLDPKALSRAHIKFIRLGFLEARYLKTIKKVELKEQYYSNDPKVRQVQKIFRQKGLPLHMLPRVEHDFKLGIGALFNSKKLVGVGGMVGYTMSYRRPNGDIVAGTFSIGGLEKGAVVSAAIKYAIKHKKGKVSFSAGAFGGGGKEIGSLGGATLGVSFDFNIPRSGYVVGFGATAGVGVGGITGFHWGAAVFAGYSWEQGRALKAKTKEAMKKYESIFTVSGFNPEKMRLIRSHPNENIKALVRYADLLFTKTGKPCPDKVLYLLWQRKVSQIKRAVERNQTLPWVKSLGVFFGVGGSAMTPIAFGGGLYITFKVPGTDEVIAVRQVAGRFNQFSQERAASAEIARKLKISLSKVKMSSFELKGESALMYYDPRIGGTGLARVGMLEKSQNAEFSSDTSFLQIKKIFKGLDIDAKLVPVDPKNPKKGSLIQITPLDIEGSNVEIQIDPDLMKKGLILDNKDPQRILLTASAVKLLMITRKRIKFPFSNKGGMNLDIITFKDRTNRYTDHIRSESPQYIYKKRGKRYEMVNSENVRDIGQRRRNVMSLAEYKARMSRDPKRYERFKNTPLINLRENRRLTVALSRALRVKSAKEFTYQAGNATKIPGFAKEWYKIKYNKRYLTRVLNSGSPLKETSYKTRLFKRLKKDFKTIYEVDLNDFELSTMYSILINEHFTLLPKKGNEKKINRLLKARNELFRRYMIKYVSRWKAKYNNEWAKIREIDPKITPLYIANYLFLAMPQNFQQLQDKLKSPQAIGKYMKFLSYSQRGHGETMPTVYGASNPASIQKFFKLFGPTALKLNAINKRQRAIAHTVFGMLSPLDRKELETPKEKAEFLNSELPLMLISLYDPVKKLSPMIEVLGKGNFSNMVEIYKAARTKNLPKLRTLLKPGSAHQKSFDEFRKMVIKVREAQLAGKKMVKIGKHGKFVLHMDTKVMVGPYLKCGNGTILASQRFSITTKKRLRTAWAGARGERNVLVKGKYRKVARYLTIAAGVVVTPGSKGEVPDTEVPKDEVLDVTPDDASSGSMGVDLPGGGIRPPASDDTGTSGSMG